MLLLQKNAINRPQPLSGSEELPYLAYVTELSQTDPFCGKRLDEDDCGKFNLKMINLVNLVCENAVTGL